MKKYTISDGEMMLYLEDAGEGWFTVTSPVDPALITQARSIPEAFKQARDALAALILSRQDIHRWDRAPKRARRKSA